MLTKTPRGTEEYGSIRDNMVELLENPLLPGNGFRFSEKASILKREEVWAGVTWLKAVSVD